MKGMKEKEGKEEKEGDKQRYNRSGIVRYIFQKTGEKREVNKMNVMNVRREGKKKESERVPHNKRVGTKEESTGKKKKSKRKLLNLSSQDLIFHVQPTKNQAQKLSESANPKLQKPRSN